MLIIIVVINTAYILANFYGKKVKATVKEYSLEKNISRIL